MLFLKHISGRPLFGIVARQRLKQPPSIKLSLDPRGAEEPSLTVRMGGCARTQLRHAVPCRVRSGDGAPCVCVSCRMNAFDFRKGAWPSPPVSFVDKNTVYTYTYSTCTVSVDASGPLGYITDVKRDSRSSSRNGARGKLKFCPKNLVSRRTFHPCSLKHIVAACHSYQTAKPKRKLKAVEQTGALQ